MSIGTARVKKTFPKLCAYSRTYNIAYAHARRSSASYTAPLYTKKEEQPKLRVRYNNSRGLGSCSCSVLTLTSTAMIFNSSLRARAMYTRNTCCEATQ